MRPWDRQGMFAEEPVKSAQARKVVTSNIPTSASRQDLNMRDKRGPCGNSVPSLSRVRISEIIPKYKSICKK